MGYTKRDRKRAEDIRQTTKVEDVILKTKTLKWRWVGHMLRDTGDKWTRDVSLWTPRFHTRRKRGRQRKRWSDEIRRVAGPLWQRAALSREKWKELEEAFVSQRHADYVSMYSFCNIVDQHKLQETLLTISAIKV
ncbi:uncharacterized protein LOC123661761 [Melitaea cinxia]|uniref:uncharacterized protein LOC123661761 n=1 Tax=Melitaea cinxia TaxID=113334 RepID=UPI001E272698|nr:uncharacterized protein LOC123661761 [Melitaea cinxia]